MTDNSEFSFEALNIRLRSILGKQCVMEIALEAIHDVVVLETLFQLMARGDIPVRWRAAWVLEKVSQLQPCLLEDRYYEIVGWVMSPEITDGHRRLLLGVLYNLSPSEELNVCFFDFLLDKMVDLRTSPGVQALSMKLAFRMSRMNDDLHEEFLCILRGIYLEYYSAAVKSVVRNCLKCCK